ncbi:hypothetical protein ACQ4PT_043291 [Festuca glaucescens]
MLSRFCKVACGVSPSSTTAMTTDDIHDGKPRSSGLSSPLLSSELPRSHLSIVAFSPEEDNEDAAAALPCLAFGSEDGYMAFSLGEGRMRGDVAMRLARGRRHVPSPYGGKVFATDMHGRYPCHLVDPFTGEVTPLPDLPIPFSEESPMPVARDEPEPPRFRLSTEDGFAWDWSARGVMVARGDTVFFCETDRVIDPPPRLGDITWALLVASTDDVLLLVRRRSRNRYCDADETIFQTYRAPHRGQLPDKAIRWEPVTDIGDCAVFVDPAHGFTVRAGEGAMRNCVYRTRVVELEEEERSRRDGAALEVVVSPLSDLRKTKVVERSEVLRRCKFQPIWGGGYWIMCNHGQSPLYIVYFGCSLEQSCVEKFSCWYQL